MISLLTRFAADVADPACKQGHGFFGFPHWYEYLQLGNVTGTDPDTGKAITIAKCQIINFTLPGDLILVVLAIIDILIHVAGLVAIVYVVIGGAQYVTSQGNPDATAKARSTILNALIGLAVAVTAIAFVSFIGSKLGA